MCACWVLVVVIMMSWWQDKEVAFRGDERVCICWEEEDEETCGLAIREHKRKKG